MVYLKTDLVKGAFMPNNGKDPHIETEGKRKQKHL